VFDKRIRKGAKLESANTGTPKGRKEMTITETKTAFVYAGHTFRIDVETYDDGNEAYDLTPLSSVPLDERGTYPLNFATFEAIELIDTWHGVGGSGKESLPVELANTVGFLIRSGEFEKAGK